MDAASIAAADLRTSSSKLRAWSSFGIREALDETTDLFQRKGDGDGIDDDEEELKWAAIETLPTVSRARKGVLNRVLESWEESAVEVDYTRLGSVNRKILIDNVLRIVEEDNGRFFWRLRARIDGNKEQDLLNFMGAMYASIFFLGGHNATSVQSTVSIERTVFYREKAAGMYSAMPYALAQVSIEMLYVPV